MSSYMEGAYYYQYLIFTWGLQCVYPQPSIYSIKEGKFIFLPYVRTYMAEEKVPVIYLPWEYENCKVIVK